MTQSFETDQLPGEGALPLVIRPADRKHSSRKDLMKLVQAERGWLEEKLLEHGGILFVRPVVVVPHDGADGRRWPARGFT